MDNAVHRREMGGSLVAVSINPLVVTGSRFRVGDIAVHTNVNEHTISVQTCKVAVHAEAVAVVVTEWRGGGSVQIALG